MSMKILLHTCYLYQIGRSNSGTHMAPIVTHHRSTYSHSKSYIVLLTIESIGLKHSIQNLSLTMR